MKIAKKTCEVCKKVLKSFVLYEDKRIASYALRICNICYDDITEGRIVDEVKKKFIKSFEKNL